MELIHTCIIIIFSTICFAQEFETELKTCELENWFVSFNMWDEQNKDSKDYQIVRIGYLQAKVNTLNNEICLNENKIYVKDSLVALLYYKLGSSYREENRINESLECFKETINLLKEYTISIDFVGKSYRNIGSIYRLQKDFKQAKQYFDKALHIFAETDNSSMRFVVYSEIMINYVRQNKFVNDSDVVDFIKSVDNDKDASEWDRIVFDINSLLPFYLNSKQLLKAEKLCIRGIQFFKEKKIPQNEAAMLKNLAEVYIEMNEFEKSTNQFEKLDSIITSGKVSLQYYNFGADIYSLKKKFYEKQNKFEEALNQVQLTLQYINPLFTYETIYQNPNSNQIFGNPYLLTTLAGKAEIFKKIYHQTEDKNNLSHALNCYELSYKAADEMRKNYSFENANTYLSNYTYNYYEKAIELCQTLAKVSPEQQNEYQQKAFEIAQRSKMKTLFWEINSRSVDYHYLDDLNKTKKNKLNAKLISLEEELKDKSASSDLRNQRFETKQMLDKINLELQDKIAGYSDTQFCHFSDFFIDQKTIQHNLKDKEALLNYFVGDSLVYCFVSTKNQFKIFEIENSQAIIDNIDLFRNEIDREENTKNSGYQLYRQLLEKILIELSPQIDNLIIVPDGALSALPFEVLQKTNSYHDYLIKNYTISYDLHSFFFAQRKEQTLPIFVKIFGCSVEDFSNYDPLKLEGLPNSKLEVETIRNSEKDLIVHSATKQQFIKHLAKFEIVHISTHAIADTLDASNSQIYFFRSGENLSDDILTRNEILNQQCKAEMIVLSACETGLGKYNRGEGVASLARAFRTIGSKSEVMSLWSIGDDSTAKIIDHFYNFLKKGLPKNEALRMAKLQYLEDQSTDLKKNPINWAGLVLQGNVEPLY